MGNFRKTILLGILFSCLGLVITLSGCGTNTTANNANQNQPSIQSTQNTSGTTPAPAASDVKKQPSTPVTATTTTTSTLTPSSSTAAPKSSPTIETSKPVPTPAPAPSPKPVAASAPVTSSGTSGQTIFAAQCASCHGNNGIGGSAPALKGISTQYASQSALAGFLQKNMPLSNPGSLSASQSSELATYLYSLGK